MIERNLKAITILITFESEHDWFITNNDEEIEEMTIKAKHIFPKLII